MKNPRALWRWAPRLTSKKRRRLALVNDYEAGTQPHAAERAAPRHAR